ncbi:hypothetical protein MMC11_004876 [Xylographa trunciseda]|nr:hypothetical protein [Xylographa trunciseda]
MAPSSTFENLSRLASKPGVQFTLVLSRADGAIIQATGFAMDGMASPTDGNDLHKPAESRMGLAESVDEKTGYARNGAESSKNAEAVAKMVYQFVSTTAGLVNDLEDGDDVQLVRLRTRKSEIVIVPDSTYILAVIYDPPKVS